MATGNPAVGVDVVARLDQFKAAMEQVPGIGSEQAKALARQLSKELKAVEKAAKDASRAGREMGDGYRRAGDTFGKVGQSGAKLAGILSLISPEAAEVARGVNDIGDAGEVATASAQGLGVSMSTVGVALAGVAAVAGTVYTAYRYLHEEEDRGIAIADRMREARAKLKPLLEDEKQALIDLRVANGELSEGEAAGLRARMKAHQEVTAALKGNADRVKELHAAEGGLARGLGDFGDVLRGLPGGALNPVSYALDAFTTSSSEAAAEIDQLMKGNADLAATAKGATTTIATQAASTRTAAGAADGHAAALRREAEALQALSDAYAGENDSAAASVDAYRASLDALRKAEATSNEAGGGAQSTQAKLQRELTEQRAALAEGLAVVGENGSARETLIEQHAATEKAIRAKYTRERLADEEAAAQALADIEVQAQQARQDAMWSTVGVGADALSTLFGDSKAAAAATAALNTALAVSQALTLPPPFGLIQAGIAGAMGLGEQQKIASTAAPFHAGGLKGGTDEFMHPVLSGEAVLSRAGRSAMGDEAIQRANAGLPSSAAPPVVQATLQYGHRSHDQFLRRTASKRGGYLNGVVSQGANYGRGA